MPPLGIKAHCKINLGLEVLNKRGDGYHNINSVFLETCLYDLLLFINNRKIVVETIPDLGIPMQENIVYKAAKMLINRKFINTGAKITLFKQIPSGAGLGGGSADAAAALKGLTQIWDLEITDGEMLDMALALGSDVPFFIKGGAALAESRGEKLTHFEYSLPYWLLMVHPGIHVSTPEAYKSLARSTAPNPKTDFRKLLLKNDFEAVKNKFNNHFEEMVFRKYPAIGSIKRQMYDSGALFASMSGSGSAVYGFFNDKRTARKAEIELARNFTYLCPPGDWESNSN